MNIIKGDLIKLAEAGRFDIIVHGCNCFTTMGSGIARQIKDQYPKAYEADCKTESGNIDKLGSFTFHNENGFTIVNAYTQYDFNSFGENKDKFEYASFEVILRKLAYYSGGQRFGFPMIGMGLAGGNKTRIMGLLSSFNEEVTKKGGTVTIVEYQPNP